MPLTRMEGKGKAAGLRAGRSRLDLIPARGSTDMTYRLEGRFVEACDCNTICPCWIDREPDGDECTGLFVWEITSGVIDNVVVNDLNVASVSYHTGRRTDAEQRVAMFVDESADDSRAALLEDVFSGRRGGTVAELGQMLGELISVERTRITVEWRDTGPLVTVGDAVSLDGEIITGATGRPITLVDSAMARVLGSPAQIGVSAGLNVNVPDADLTLAVAGKAVTSGLFSYRG